MLQMRENSIKSGRQLSGCAAKPILWEEKEQVLLVIYLI